MASDELNVETTYIYGLADPGSGAIRYVGKADNPQARMKSHLKDKSQNYRGRCIRSLLQKGLKPALVIIQKVAKTEWQEWERYWISLHKEAGQSLTNETSGGDGAPDLSQDARVKISTAQIGNQKSLGYKHTPEELEKMGAATRGKQQTLEHRAKCSAAKTGQIPWNKGRKLKKHTPETIEKMRVAKRGNKYAIGHKHTVETKEKQRIARKAWWALRRVQKQMTALVDQAREDRNSDAS